MPTISGVTFAPVDGAAELFSPEFCVYFAHMHRTFGPRVAAFREARSQTQQRRFASGSFPRARPRATPRSRGGCRPFPPNSAGPASRSPAPPPLRPCSSTPLNPGVDGVRAEGDLDDDEDSAGHRLVDTVRAAHNRMQAVGGGLTYHDEARGRDYAVQEGPLPFFMHRERGLHLDEPEVTIEGKPVSAAILGACLTLFHAGRAQAAHGLGIYFYLPKIESARETAFWRHFSRRASSASSTCAPRPSAPSRSSNRCPPCSRWRRSCTSSGRTPPG